MKKMIIIALFAVVATAANAAAFNWSATMIYGSDSSTRWSGDVTLYCAEISSFSASTTAANGVVAKTKTSFSDEAFVAGETYNFYFVIEDNGKTFTSDKVAALAQLADTATVAFGNMQNATQNSSNWKSSGDVPEPTTGLLVLLGVSSLALKRKIA